MIIIFVDKRMVLGTERVLPSTSFFTFTRQLSYNTIGVSLFSVAFKSIGVTVLNLNTLSG